MNRLIFILVMCGNAFVFVAVSCGQADRRSPYPTTDFAHIFEVPGSRVAGYDPDQGLGYRFRGGMVFSMSGPHEAHKSQQLVFSAVVDREADLFLLDEKKKLTYRLSKTPYWEVWPNFSPSDNFITFISDRDSPRGELYAMDLSSGSVLRVAPHVNIMPSAADSPWLVGLPTAAPQGDSIAFSGYAPTAHQCVYVVDLTRPLPKVISQPTDDCCCPVWSANGTYLVFTKIRKYQRGRVLMALSS
jgi:Tol biopolymer transport system component